MTVQLPPLDARIPKWNLADLIDRSCPICRSPGSHTVYVRPDELNVRFCDKCYTYFVSPSPSDRQLHAFYESYDEKHRRLPRINPIDLAASYKGVEPLADIRIRELSSLMKFEASQVLDIGFGRAHFLYCLKKLGAIPFGLELDKQAIELATFLGIDVFHGNMVDFVSEIKYDLIVLIDFVEHPLNPMSILNKASELLQSGGFLLIWTPNGDFVRLKKVPTTFMVDLEHMQYFTPNTCCFIASELRLGVVHLETLGFPALEGIERLSSEIKPSVLFIKRILKLIPGFSAVNRFRYKLLENKQQERTGAYHLFCIMQKPA